MFTSNQTNPFGLSALFADARRSVSFFEHSTPGFDNVRVVPKEAAVVGLIRLADGFPAPSGEQLRSLDFPSTQRAAGTVYTMSHAIMAASRVVQAGARLIPISDAPTPVPDTPVVAWTKRASRFEVVTAPPFAVVADGEEVETSILPVAGADIDLGESASHAISFTLSRLEQKNRSDADLEFIVARSLALGLARLCDAALLGAIVAKVPEAFSLAKAAARGLHFTELRAMCGSAAQSAAVGADGTLRVQGVGAAMTDVIAPSVIGVFGRAAVAVEDEIRVVIKRTSTRGDMEVTVFASVAPVLPTPDFWVAA